MPLDTSIPLQIGRAPQVQALDPMTMYNAMQERQINALRAQALQQEMAQNALTMQNTMEDRRIAAAARAQAAAQAAEERRRLGEYRGVLSGFGTTPAAIGQRGASYSGTGVSTDPYAYVQNELLRRGFVPQAEELAKVQKEQLAGEESKAKIPGLKATSEENIVKARAAKIGQYGDAVLRASTPEEVYALIDSHADTLKELGFTADQAKKNFADLAARSGFDNAIMQSAKGAMATREHFDKMLTGQAGRTDVITGADGNTYLLDKASGAVTPTTMATTAKAPAAGAPASFRASPTTEAQIKQAAIKEALPGAIETAELTLKQLEEMVGSENLGTKSGVPAHPGFEDAVGATYKPFARLVPGTAAADFSARFDQIQGGAFLKAYETLKGTGQITEKEGEKATAAINRMSLAQSEAEFTRAAREFYGVVNSALTRAKTKMGGASAASSAGAAVPSVSTGDADIDALLNKYGK